MDSAIFLIKLDQYIFIIGISSIMVIIGAPFVGLSYFIWNNGILMLISCVVFAFGLALLLYRKEERTLELEKNNHWI